MLNLRILIFWTIIGFISCVKIKFSEEIKNGRWNTKQRISFPLTIGDKHYIFCLTDNNTGRFWFIQELRDDGTPGLETSQGTWKNYYTQVFPFIINDKQFIYGIDNRNYWFIQEVLPGGQMGKETDSGYWKSKPTMIFPFDISGKHYMYSLTDNDWFIKELLPNGKIGSETDCGSWNNYYTLGFPFSINDKQYIYSIGNKNWFIREVLSGGKMGNETDNGHWTTNHILYVPFRIEGKNYLYGVTNNNHNNTNWFIQELLSSGKMGTEKSNGPLKFYYAITFSLNIDGRQMLYGLSGYNWFIQEIIGEPRLSVISNTKENNLSRPKRSGGLNAGEELVTEIEDDHVKYMTMSYEDPNKAIKSVSTLHVAADANHRTSVDLTVAMRAEIHYRHMAPRRDPVITPEVRTHLERMDRETDDEAGHLLASSLGGPGVPFNFAPQSPMLNRAVNVARCLLPQPGWFDVEEMLRDYLIATQGFIRWSLAPLYAFLPNSRRPTAFLLSIRFYDAQGNLVSWQNEGAVRFYNFRNVPKAACTNRNHPWWNHNNPY